ncbi:MAG: hypothetical protein AMXMBFR82_00870 [Candidatus Hydrogenedentota bacterium]
MTARKLVSDGDYSKAWETALKVELTAAELSAGKSRKVARRLEKVYRLLEDRAPLSDVAASLQETAECL